MWCIKNLLNAKPHATVYHFVRWKLATEELRAFYTNKMIGRQSVISLIQLMKLKTFLSKSLITNNTKKILICTNHSKQKRFFIFNVWELDALNKPKTNEKQFEKW